MKGREREMRRYTDKRRARNQAARRCINDTVAGTHGLATHGCRCKRCYATHKGVPVEQVSDVRPQPRIHTMTIGVSERTFDVIAAAAKARGMSLRAVADELIGGGSMPSSPGTERAA